MRKSYHCVFGSTRSIDELESEIGKRLDIKFEPHDSSYLGQYVNYSGLFSDRLTIERNQKNAEDWRYEEFKNYPTLILFNNTEGKNADKLSKTKYLKSVLLKIPNVTLLKETVLEENA